MRRFTRLTNGFSKKVENLEHAVSLHFMHYNFARIHKTLRVTPAMGAGVSDHMWTLEEIRRIGRLRCWQRVPGAARVPFVAPARARRIDHPGKEPSHEWNVDWIVIAERLVRHKLFQFRSTPDLRPVIWDVRLMSHEAVAVHWEYAGLVALVDVVDSRGANQNTTLRWLLFEIHRIIEDEMHVLLVLRTGAQHQRTADASSPHHGAVSGRSAECCFYTRRGLQVPNVFTRVFLAKANSP